MRPRRPLFAFPTLAAPAAFAICLALGVAPGITAAHAGRVALTAYTVVDGLPSDDVRALVFDHRGFLWVGTTDGLARFDGGAFRVFGTGDGLPHATIWALLETRDHVLWAGTDRGLAAAALDDPRGRGFAVVECDGCAGWQPADRAAVTALFEDRDGAVWAGSVAGPVVFTRNGDGWRGTPLDLPALCGEPPRREPVLSTSFAQAGDGSLWMTATDGLYHRDARGRWHHLTTGDGLPAAILRRVVVDSRDRAWVIGHGEALVVVAAGAEGAPSVQHVVPLRGRADVDAHFFLGPGSGRDAWLGSWSGLARLDLGDEIPRPRESLGLAAGFPPNQEPRFVLGDARGDLWIGTNRAGLWRWQREGATTYTSEDGIGHGVAALYVAKDGAPVFVDWRDQHVLHVFDGTRFATVAPRFPAAYPGSWLTPILQDHTGAWWIGSSAGVCRFAAVRSPGRSPGRSRADLDGRPPERCFGAADDVGGLVAGLHEDRRGDVWITLWSGTRQVRRWERATGHLHAYGAEDGLGDDWAMTTIVDDAAGHTWFASDNGGLYRFDGERFRRFDARDGWTGAGVSAAAVDPSGRLWFALHLDGLLVIDDPASARPAMRRIGRAQGLVSDSATAIAAMPDGSVFVGGVRGLTWLDRDGRVTRQFGVRDGLPRTAISRLAVDGAGDLWALATPDVVRLHLPQRPLPAPAPPLFAAVRAGGQAQAVPLGGLSALDGLELPAAAPDLEIALMSPAPGLAAPARYLVDLDGPSEVHVGPRDDGRVELPRLRPGRYTLRARTIGLSRTPSAGEARARFVVLAPWWRRAWFWTIASAALALAAYGVHRLRLARLLAVERMRTRIATDLHDDIGSSLSSIAIQAGLLHRRLRTIDALDRDRLARIGETAGELVETMGDIVWSVNPRHDHLSDLAHRMHHFARETTDAAGIALVFDAPLAADVVLDPPVRRQVYLVFKELLTNAVRHAGAAKVEVLLERTGGRLRLCVRDDGRGFGEAADGRGPVEAAGGRAGTGLHSMRRRAAEIGATLSIATDADRGGVRAELVL